MNERMNGLIYKANKINIISLGPSINIYMYKIQQFHYNKHIIKQTY